MKKIAASLALAALMMSSQGALAQALLSLPLEAGAQLHSTSYDCGNGVNIAVSYVQSGPSSLALVTRDGHTQIYAEVIAASGARYAADSFTWWSKGDTASFEDSMNASAALECKAAS